MYIPVLTANAGLSQWYQQMKPALILLAIIAGILIATCVAFTLMAVKNCNRTQRIMLVTVYIATALVILCTAACLMRYRAVEKALTDEGANSSVSTSSGIETDPSTTEGAAQEATDETDPVPAPTFTPEFTDSSNPENWNIKWEIFHKGSVVDSYQAEQPISFGKPDAYFALPGISTFRGNNLRNGATYGTATVELRSLSKLWSNNNVGALNNLSGMGWTGQPLIVKWDTETKAIMNLYPEKKEKEDLIEIICATLDGNIYFYDLEDGAFTRKPVCLGMPFKGTGSLDPRGYPILYVGSGDFIDGKAPRMYAISLIDGSILYESSGSDDFGTANRYAFNSAPLVDNETDTLIWPCGNGVLYTIKLNTAYDKSTGTLSVAPEDIVKTRYSTKRSNSSTYQVGYEASAVIVDRYLYISENGGMFFCIDLDTMSLVWAQDTKDNSLSSPVFEWNGLDDGYIYTAPSLRWNSNGKEGSVSIYKLNAKTGEIVWEKKFDCRIMKDVSGGVYATPVLGRPGTQLEGMIIYPIARTPNDQKGNLVALDTETGEIVWELPMDNYTCSSPVGVYTESGDGYIIVGDSAGKMFMVDFKGNLLSTLDLGSAIDASPAVYENTLVVGTRVGSICGVKIK